jgi:hypothetical protein
MFQISSGSRSKSNGSISWEDGDTSIDSSGEIYRVVTKANTADLNLLFKKYNQEDCF